jgi:hypothetical protein
MAKEHLRRRQWLSEAGGAEVSAQRVPPERGGEEEAPGVRKRQLRANASAASPLASAATTQAGLICIPGPRRRLCRAGRRLAQVAQGHDLSEWRGLELIFTVAATLRHCGQVNRNIDRGLLYHSTNKYMRYMGPSVNLLRCLIYILNDGAEQPLTGLTFRQLWISNCSKGLTDWKQIGMIVYQRN